MHILEKKYIKFMILMHEIACYHLSSSMYEKHTYRVPLKEFLKLFKYLDSSGNHTVSGLLDLLFKDLHQEKKEKKGDNSHKAYIGTLSCGRSPPIYRHLV